MNGPHRFSLRGSNTAFFRPRKKPLNPGPCSRGPSFAANTAREFFYPRVEIRPTWNSNSRPRRGDYTSAPLTNQTRGALVPSAHLAGNSNIESQTKNNIATVNSGRICNIARTTARSNLIDKFRKT